MTVDVRGVERLVDALVFDPQGRAVEIRDGTCGKLIVPARDRIGQRQGGNVAFSDRRDDRATGDVFDTIEWLALFKIVNQVTGIGR